MHFVQEQTLNTIVRTYSVAQNHLQRGTGQSTTRTRQTAMHTFSSKVYLNYTLTKRLILIVGGKHALSTQKALAKI